MADRGGAAAGGAAGRGAFGSRGAPGGDRGRGRGRGRGPRRGGQKSDEKEWQPVTKLGRLVKAGKIKNMEEIYLHSMPVKEYQIVDFFLPGLKDEVMKVRVSAQNFSRGCERLQDFGGRQILRHTISNQANTDGLPLIDQASTKANSCRSTHSLQGCRSHWRQCRPCWTRHQNIKGGRNSHSCRHHHCETQCCAYPPRLLGYESG